MIVKKTCLCLLLACVIIQFNSIGCSAHENAREHDKELETVLFGEGYSKYQSENIKKNITALEYASSLTIDQFGGNDKSQFDALKKMKMGGLPSKFESIDYSQVPGETKSISPNTHRKYTHQGWDRNYSSAGKEIDKFWKTRRKVLLGTVDTIFDFDDDPFWGYGEKCNSLSGIIYYVHILGDYDEADKYTKIALLPDLAGRQNANPNDMDYDMITSLKAYIEVLFSNQKSSYEYKKLMEGLENIEKKAGKIVNSVGGVNTDEEFEEYHQYAEDIMKLLQTYMPKLLKSEAFFADVFYPDYTR